MSYTEATTEVAVCVIANLPADVYTNGFRIGTYPAVASDDEIAGAEADDMEVEATNKDELLAYLRKWHGESVTITIERGHYA